MVSKLAGPVATFAGRCRVSLWFPMKTPFCKCKFFRSFSGKSRVDVSSTDGHRVLREILDLSLDSVRVNYGD